MRRNIDEAFKLYSGDKPLGLFADKLEYNLGKLNELYDEIEAIFRSAGVGNFENCRKITQSADSLPSFSSVLITTWKQLKFRASLGINCPMK